MDSEWARDMVRWLRHCYAVSERATIAELVAICEARSCDVIWSRDIRAAAVYVRCPEPVIVMQWHSGAYVLAHELAHHLIADNAEHGIGHEELTLYAYHSGRNRELECVADYFAELLCGDPWGD